MTTSSLRSTSPFYDVTTSGSSSSNAFSSSTTGVDPATQYREEIQSEPFLQFSGLTNGTWFAFLIIAVASSRLGTLGPRIGLPLITTYMIVGCICGPYILNLITTQELPDIAYITQIALSFIAFSAGSELYLPELRSLFRKIIAITTFNALYTYVICAVFIYGLAASGIIAWITPYLGGCASGISLIAASIMVARSPASAIAVVRELRAKGPITSTMLGVTVVGDVVVLVLFTLSTSIALAQCSGAGFEGGAFLITLLTLVAAVGLGYLLGGLLIFLLWVPYARGLILPLGFFIFLFSDWWAVYSLDHYGVSINFDSLLICITAGYVATNQSRNRTAFLKLLGSSASFVFIPFFTKVGVELNLKVLYQSLPFAVLVFLMRLLCIFLGTVTGGFLTKAGQNEKYFIWATMLAQAGVSLGLASEVAVKFPDWSLPPFSPNRPLPMSSPYHPRPHSHPSTLLLPPFSCVCRRGRNFQTSIIAVVLINQFVGPVACKFALKSVFKEAGKMKDGEDAHGGEAESHHSDKVKRVLLIGVDLITLETAQRLLDRGYAVTLMDTDRGKLALTSVLEAAQRDIVGLEKGNKGEGGNAVGAEKKGGGRRKDDLVYASLEPLEAERQESVLVEEEGAEEGRTVEVEEGGDEEEEEEVDSAVHTESRIDTKLIPPYTSATTTTASSPSSSSPSSSSVSPLVESFTSLITPLLSSPLSSLHSALVFLPSDADTLTVSSLLISTFHVHLVLARLHNSTWAPQAVSLGVVPLSVPSLSSQVVTRVLMEGDVDPVEVERVGEGRLNSLPHVFASFIGEGDERVNEWAMEKEERDHWLSAHPPWSEESGGGVGFSQAMTGGVSMNVVPTALREDYLSRMLASQNASDEGDIKQELREATEAFLSPAAMREVERGDKKEEGQ